MDGPNSYVGSSAFARAVNASGFGRVCPKCYAQWSDKHTFIIETRVVGSEVGVFQINNPAGEGITEIRCPKRIHEHLNCGGQMYIDIHDREAKRESKKQKQGN